MPSPPPPSATTDPAPALNRLRDTFSSHPASAHPEQWDLLWKDAYTPWDRGTPSLALADLLTSHPSLFPSLSPTTTTRPTALVPGCGRGYDALLLSSFGYDVTGLDVSETSLARAAEIEKVSGGEEVYAARDPSRGKGKVTWLAADFFDSDAEGMKGRQFDLVFDYTFFVALPPSLRPRWALRMAQLVRPAGGRLVCLEWPLTKDPVLGGPPWAPSREAYVAHLGRPGKEVEYASEGVVATGAAEAGPSAGGLELLFREKPKRTHKAGYNESGEVVDYISVWGHVQQQQS